MNGYLIINKPEGESSFDSVRKVRMCFREKRVGHAGTLDPFASGVLIVALGRYTKTMFLFDGYEKEYIATGVFGEARDTDDKTGKTIKQGITDTKILQQDIEQVLKELFTGTIKQIPPLYSAKHVDGRRAYSLAREGVCFELQPSDVDIHKISLLEYNYPRFTIKASVGKGTYIRSIVRDIGAIFGHLAYTESIIRVRIGGCRLEDATHLNNETKLQSIISFKEMFPHLESSVACESLKAMLLSGNTHAIESECLDASSYKAYLDSDGELLAIIENKGAKNVYAYVGVQR